MGKCDKLKHTKHFDSQVKYLASYESFAGHWNEAQVADRKARLRYATQFIKHMSPISKDSTNPFPSPAFRCFSEVLTKRHKKGESLYFTGPC
jgi:hypothetical protein